MLYWDSIRPKSVIDVFKAPQLGIASIEKEFGELWLRAIMVKWVNAFLNFYSTNGTMGDLQVADTINLMIEEYPHYTQEDFKLFFNMAKKGMFGQVYGRVDGEVVMRWLKEYDIHRDTIAQKLSIQEAEQYKPRFQSENKKGNDLITFTEYRALKKRAEEGDAEAIGLLKKK